MRNKTNIHLLVPLLISMSSAIGADSKYTMTIYVDLHSATSSGIANTGHVFFKLSDGNRDTVIGYQGDQNLGQVTNQREKVEDGIYDVSKTYQISADGFHAALAKAGEWNKIPLNNTNDWDIDHHCGVLTEAVAHAAGLTLDGFGDMYSGSIGGPRPSLWAKYLCGQGCDHHQYGEHSSVSGDGSDDKPAQANDSDCVKRFISNDPQSKRAASLCLPIPNSDGTVYYPIRLRIEGSVAACLKAWNPSALARAQKACGVTSESK